MRHHAVIAMLVLSAAVALAAAAGGRCTEQAATVPAASGPADGEAMFHTVDVLIRAEAPLAAWQLEFATGREDVLIVGVEEAPGPFQGDRFFFDHRAVRAGSERIIVAGFSTRPVDDLPRGEFRIATIHLMGPLDLTTVRLQLQAAADADGRDVSPELFKRWGPVQ